MDSAENLIRMNDFQAQWEMIGASALGAVERVGKSGRYILGEEVASFERDLARQLGIPFVVGCASGLDAIEIGLRALGLKQGERVITTPLTAFATTLAIIRAGGIPVFVDVDQSGLLDLSLVEEVLKKDSDIRFIVPVHLYGHVVDLVKLDALRAKYGIVIVEDCAQAIGCKSYGIAAGSIGEYAGTSFYPTKNLGGMGDGGAVLCGTLERASLAKTLRNYGQSEQYRHEMIGMNSRLDEIQAALLRDAFLPHLGQFCARRAAIANKYKHDISHLSISIPPVPEGSSSGWHLFPILIKQNRQSFREYLLKQGIETGVHYPVPVPHQKCLSGERTEVLMSLPNAEMFALQEVSLPIHPFLSDSDVERIVTVCNSWMP